MTWAGVTRCWDLVRGNLEPREGSEQGGARPAWVVSNDGFSRHFPLLTVLPLTSLGQPDAPMVEASWPSS